MEERKIQAGDEINLLDIFILILKHKRMIISVTLMSAIITAVIVLVMPDIYLGEARILPPQQNSVSSQLLSQFGGNLTSLAGGILGTSSSSDLYAYMLKSRTVYDRIIDRFDLMNIYKNIFQKYFNLEVLRVNIRDKLDDNIKIDTDVKSGVITIDTLDEDPKKAADMANAFVEELQKLANGIAISEAAQRRMFYDDQARTTKIALTKAEDEMKAFAEKTGVMQPDAQATAVITGIASLNAQIAAAQVNVDVLRTYSTPNNPEFQKAQEQLQGLKAEMGKMESRRSSGHDPLMPTERIPSVSLEYERKLRDVKFNETLYELLVKLRESAKLDEARNPAVIQIVDRAIPMDKKTKPQRTLIVLIVAFTSFLITLVVAFFKEYKERTKNIPGNEDRLETIRKYSGCGLKELIGFKIHRNK